MSCFDRHYGFSLIQTSVLYLLEVELQAVLELYLHIVVLQGRYRINWTCSNGKSYSYKLIQSFIGDVVPDLTHEMVFY